MPLDLQPYIFIDNHAHSLAKEHMQLDAFGFRQPFTESRSRAMVLEHVPHSLSYQTMLRRLGGYLEASTEQEILTRRSAKKAGSYVSRLWDTAGIGALIVDDGYCRDQMLSLPELARVGQRPVYACRRIESVIEECLKGAQSFPELRYRFQETLLSHSPQKPVALKTILSYRGGLHLSMCSPLEAEEDFCTKQEELTGGKVRITSRPLYHFLLMEALEQAGACNLPVQVHVGIGDDDADIALSNPALLQPLFRLRTLRQTRFVLLHCYPFIKEAALLAALYPNVYLDLSLAVNLVAPMGKELILQALSCAPPTKLLAGTDGHTCAESHWWGTISFKLALESALNELIGRGFMLEEQAALVAGQILHGNARALYDLEGLA
jgi:uncharacterized protein